MDQRTAFMELSALLTGIYRIVVDPTERALSEPTADEYWRRLVAAFPDRLPKLLDAYHRCSSGCERNRSSRLTASLPSRL
jgi:hypothetical protein